MSNNNNGGWPPSNWSPSFGSSYGQVGGTTSPGSSWASSHVYYDASWTRQPSMGSLSIQNRATFQRDARVPQLLQRLEAESKANKASEVVFVPADGVDTKTYFWEYDRHTGSPKQMNLLDDPKGGVLRGTLCINVSGHNGPQRREEWARTNSYDVFVKLPALPGESGPLILKLQNIPRNKPGQPEYATAIDVEIPVGNRMQYGPIELLASPSGTIPQGYTEGRVYQIHSTQQPYDPSAAKAKHDGIDEDFWGL